MNIKPLKTHLNTQLAKQDTTQALQELKDRADITDKTKAFEAMRPLTILAIKELHKLLKSKNEAIRLKAIDLTLSKTLPDLKASETKHETTVKHGVVMLPPEHVIDMQSQTAKAREQASKDSKTRTIKIGDKAITVDESLYKRT